MGFCPCLEMKAAEGQPFRRRHGFLRKILMSPLQLALASDPLMPLEIALDAVGGLAAFRRPMADDPIFSRRCVRSTGRAAKADGLANSEFVFVHARPHASNLRQPNVASPRPGP